MPDPAKPRAYQFNVFSCLFMSFPGSGNWGSNFLSLLPIAAESVAGPEQVGGFGLRFDGSLVNIWWNGATTSCKLIGMIGVLIGF